MDADRAASDLGDFAITRCCECERDVLTYPDPRPEEPELRRCAHCDERATGELRWLAVADLDRLGYVVDSGEDAEGGCTSCSTGGCGVKAPPAPPAKGES